MMNAEVRGLQEGIIELLNDSHLPVEVKRLCVYEIYNRLIEAGDQAVYMERRRLGETGEESGEGGGMVQRKEKPEKEFR